jgi:hypothetical protein
VAITDWSGLHTYDQRHLYVHFDVDPGKLTDTSDAIVSLGGSWHFCHA